MIRILLIVSIVMCQGCVSKPNLLQKKSDMLIKSTCEICEQKPFYQNGKWL